MTPEGPVEVDVAERMASNLDVFMESHRAHLIAICTELEQDVDLVLMDMLCCGFNEVMGRAQQMAEENGEDFGAMVRRAKAFVKADREAKE